MDARAWLFGLALLSGCSQSEGEQAEKQYKIVLQTSPTIRELCNEQRKVAAAYLSDQNSEEYKTWDIKADLSCNEADLHDLSR